MGYSNHYLIGAAYKGKVKVVPVHTIKAYRRSGGTDPLILNFNTRWRSSQPYLPAAYPQSWSGHFRIEMNLFPLPGFKP
jgi:hypothetical protein